MKTGADQMEKLKKIIGLSKPKPSQQYSASFPGFGIYLHCSLIAC